MRIGRALHVNFPLFKQQGNRLLPVVVFRTITERMAEANVPDAQPVAMEENKSDSSSEELAYDSSAYELYHAMHTGVPCMTFDVIPHPTNSNGIQYPLTLYLIAGTTSPTLPSLNSVILMKLHNLIRIPENEDSSNSSQNSDGYLDDKPELDNINISHNGGVNRLRYSHIPGKCIVSTWSDLGVVGIYQFDKHFAAIEASVFGPTDERIKCEPIFSFAGHQCEGFAMDWSRNVAGRLLTGDCNKNIHLWQPTEGGWNVDQRPYTSHTKSVEDLQWSPNEETVFASCSCDGTMRVWDIRAPPHKACMLTTQAHDVDVNVITWNRLQPLIVSGGDDGVMKVWDLRKMSDGTCAALFKQHSGPITSVEWHPNDSPVFAGSGEDNQITQWDLSVERDKTDSTMDEDTSIPPQLLFVHKGQKQIKEIHWHTQLPGIMISTAESGFNVFKTISV